MGNTATKEARPYGPSPRYSHARGASNVSNNGGQGEQHGAESSHYGGSSRHRAGEHRRETRQEREARKLEKERAARVKERERSMKEEHVDGGYLVTQGVYVGTEDFSKPAVRQLMIERKLAPFWKGLNDFSDSWAEHQLMAAARGLPIPPPDEVPPELEYRITSKSPEERAAAEKSINSLTVPISSRSQSYNSDSSSTRPKSPSVPLPHSQGSPSSSTTQLFRGRAKTLASLTTKTSSSDMAPREFKLPHDPFVNGQPIEAYLYKAASECPICFLYYPPYFNRTRCCDQPICSECFVQIKRPDPHPPEHEHPDGNTPPSSNNEPNNQTEEQLVSEPAACPFCVQPEFGVTYAPPPFRRGLTYAASHTHPLAQAASPASSNSSLVSGTASPQPGVTRRRATSLSANSPGVITTDKIRPDWAHKLATARAHAARRSAAATALHTAAYLINSPSNEGRNFGAVSRRAMLRRATGGGTESPGGRSVYLSSLQSAGDSRRPEPERENSGNSEESALAPPRASSRRTRVDELEDMMMMEAIRLSLAAEEERRKKQEKEARKDAKKREKETKKAEKYARKNGLYSNNPSNVALNTPSSRTPPKLDSGSCSVAATPLEPSTSKGKEVERPAEAPKLSLGKLDDGQPSSPLFAPGQAEPSKKSHLRHASSASSSNSSLIESASGENIGDSTSASGSTEPMFNFRSLAAVIGDEEKDSTEHVENSTQQEPVAKAAPGISTSDGPSDSKQGDDALDQKELQAREVEVAPNRVGDVEASG